MGVLIYSLHLPENWWQDHDTDQLVTQFPSARLQFQARSKYPVISNDPFYTQLPYDAAKHLLLGDVYGLGFLPALFNKGPKAVVNGAPHWPSLGLKMSDITGVQVSRLFQAPDILAVDRQIAKAKAEGKTPWGWLNVSGILQTAWYLRGDCFFSEIQAEDPAARLIMQKSLEIVKQGYRMALKWFGETIDPRLIHSAHCFVPAGLSQKSLPMIVEFENDLRSFILQELGLPYRVHLCTAANAVITQYLEELSPICQLEITRAPDIARMAVKPVELLEGDFFSLKFSEIERRTSRCVEAGIPMVLYDMDAPIQFEAISRFCCLTGERTL